MVRHLVSKQKTPSNKRVFSTALCIALLPFSQALGQASKAPQKKSVVATKPEIKAQPLKTQPNETPKAPLNLREFPLPVCERGLSDPRFVEAIDDHINAVFAGLSMEERLAKASVPKNLPAEDRLQSLFSEIYTTDLRMKTNALIKKYNYSMPFHCLGPRRDGRGFALHLSSSPCNDPDASFTSIEEIQSGRSRKILKDLLQVGSGEQNTNAGTQLLQACSLHFQWDSIRQRYYTSKSTFSQAGLGVVFNDGNPTTETKFRVQTQGSILSHMECPFPTQMALGCHIRLHPRSEKHIYRLTESDWMPAREAVICRLPKDTATAFDAGVERLKQEIREKPEMRNSPGGVVESEDVALVRVLREMVQLRGTTVEELRTGALTYYRRIPCEHLSPNQSCNAIVSVKKHRYAGSRRDTFDYGILSDDAKNLKMFREDMTMSPFNVDRSYHDVPGMTGRSFQFTEKHGIYQVGGNPSRREVEMFCAEPQP